MTGRPLRLLGVLAVAVLLGGAGCRRGEAPLPPDTIDARPHTGEPNRFVDPQGRFSVRLPDGWATQEQPAAGRVTAYPFGEGPPTRGRFDVALVAASPQEPVEAVLSRIRARIAAECPGFRESRRGETIVAGVPGERILGDFTRDGEAWRVLAYALTRGDRAACIVGEAPRSEFEAALPIFEDAAESFRFDGS